MWSKWGSEIWSPPCLALPSFCLLCYKETRNSFNSSNQGCDLSVSTQCLRAAVIRKSQNVSRDSSSLHCLSLPTKCSGLLVSALLFSCLLPVSFLFTHSFCFLISLACLWFWPVVASSVPPGNSCCFCPFPNWSFVNQIPKGENHTGKLMFSIPPRS